MVKKRSKMKWSSLSSAMTPHHFQSHHPHPHPLLLPQCCALPLPHPPTASSGSAGETQRLQDCLVRRWELERGERRHHWLIYWLTDLQLMDAGYILIWHSLLASWMSLSITALRNWNHTSSFQRPFLPFKHSLNTFTENGTFTESIKNIWRIWTKQSLKCGITEDDRSLYLNYQLQWCLNVFTLCILHLSLFFLPICLTRGMRLSCEGSMCRSSWQPLSSPWLSLLSTKLTVQVPLLLLSFFAFWICSYLLLLSLGAVLSFPARQQAPQSTVLLLQLWNHI